MNHTPNPRKARVIATAMAGALTAITLTPLASPAPAYADGSAVSACVPHAVIVPPGATGGEVMDLNDNGIYVGGFMDGAGHGHAAYWTHTGTSLDSGWTIHTPSVPGVDPEFLDVNNAGQMNGFAYGSGEGFVYDLRTGVTTQLPPVHSDIWGDYEWARRINASGAVSGDSGGFATVWYPPYTQPTRVHAPGEARTAYGTHGVGSSAPGINDQGTVAGVTILDGRVPDVDQWAKLHQWHNGYSPLYAAFSKGMPGPVTRLQVLIDQAQGFAINNAGTTVGGAARVQLGAWVPVAWRPDGSVIDLGAPAEMGGFAYNISQGGWAVGGVYPLAGGPQRSFVWTGAGTLQVNPPLPGQTDSWSHGVDDLLRQVAGDSAGIPTVWQCPTGFTTG